MSVNFKHPLVIKELKIFKLNTHDANVCYDVAHQYNCATITEFLKIDNIRLPFHRSLQSLLIDRYEAGNPKFELKECDCGAKHTSFPKHHYHWCSVKANK